MTGLIATLLGVVAAALAGCASRSISSLSDDELCVYYYLNVADPRARLAQLRDPEGPRSYDPEARAAADAEIHRRELIAGEHWELARSGTLRPGMSRCAVLAALGVPSKANAADDIWIYYRPGQSSLYVSFQAGSVANVWVN